MIGRNRFASGIADSADTTLVLASDWNAELILGFVLTNRTGGSLAEGDVVAIDSANDKSVVLADTAGARRQYVVFISALPSSVAHAPGTSILNTEQGIFLPVGIANKVKVAGVTTRGNYLRKSATTLALEDTSVAVGSAPPGDAIATALTGTGGAGTVAAGFRGLPISPGGNLKSVQVFEANDTWTRPAGIRRVVVEVQGAGGGSGGVGTTAASQVAISAGGGGGGYACKLIDVASIASSTISVGAGGTAGAATPTAGGAGGNSSWADGTNTVTGNGGSGSGSGAATGVPAFGNGFQQPGAGGSASGGNFNLTGNKGGTAVGLEASNHATGGWGGNARLGTGGGQNGGNTPGLVGNQYGGGAGGACNLQSQGAGRVGSSGGNGVVIVWEFE